MSTSSNSTPRDPRALSQRIDRYCTVWAISGILCVAGTSAWTAGLI